MFKKMYWLYFGVGILMVFGLYQLYFYNVPGKQKLTPNIVMEIVSEKNKKLPIMVDKSTKLMGIGYSDHVISYNYRMLKFNAEELDPAYVNRIMRPKLLKNLCNKKKLKPYFDNGYSFSHNYNDKAGKSIKKILITPEDCKSLNR